MSEISGQADLFAETRTLDGRREAFFARARKNAPATQTDAAASAEASARGQSMMCFRYLLGRPLPHFVLESRIHSANGMGGRRTKPLEDLGLVEVAPWEALNPATGRWAIVKRVTELGRRLAAEHEIEPLDVILEAGLEIRPAGDVVIACKRDGS